MIAAVIYNRLRDRMQLGIDATLRYGLHIPPTQSITESELRELEPLQHARGFGLPPTPIANPGSPRSRRPHTPPTSTTSTSCASPANSTTTSPPARPRSTSTSRPTDTSDTHVALLGHPVVALALPLMQNAAFAAARLDWHYSAFDVEDAGRRGRGAAYARLRGRQRDDPPQAGGRRGLRRGGRRGREHPALPRGPGARASTPTGRSSPGSRLPAPA